MALHIWDGLFFFVFVTNPYVLRYVHLRTHVKYLDQRLQATPSADVVHRRAEHILLHDSLSCKVHTSRVRRLIQLMDAVNLGSAIGVCHTHPKGVEHVFLGGLAQDLGRRPSMM